MSGIATWELRQFYPWVWALHGCSAFVRCPLGDSRSGPPSWYEAFRPLLVVGVVRREARPERLTQAGARTTQTRARGPAR
eukprot:1799286-Pyramimonas_sp.AAC.1